jgi:hypothetical protein
MFSYRPVALLLSGVTYAIHEDLILMNTHDSGGSNDAFVI